jgi:hypothetical protein
MKLSVLRRIMLAIAEASIIIGFFSLGATAETAQCADPPGGTVTCESGQVAVCAVKNGRVDGRCKTPPPNSRAVDVQAYVLSDVTGKTVTAKDVVKGDYNKALSEGKVEKNGAIVTFKIPSERQ